jgi:thiamine pyrophosphokinase
MNQRIVDSLHGVTLVGGGPVTGRQLKAALALAPYIVGADGGADRVLALGQRPDAVIGDFDSLSDAGRAELEGRLFPISEQDSTDFDKALRNIRAPFVLGLGFVGARSDHGLAVLNSLLRHVSQPCFIIGPKDVTFLCPAQLDLTLPLGSALSLFPMGEVGGRSKGLRWPIDGLRFAPDGVIGTSNQVTGPVHLTMDAARMLCIVPIRSLRAVLRGFGLL